MACRLSFGNQLLVVTGITGTYNLRTGNFKIKPYFLGQFLAMDVERSTCSVFGVRSCVNTGKAGESGVQVLYSKNYLSSSCSCEKNAQPLKMSAFTLGIHRVLKPV